MTMSLCNKQQLSNICGAINYKAKQHWDRAEKIHSSGEIILDQETRSSEIR